MAENNANDGKSPETPGAGLPAVDIPDLKKKEKERKKGGAALGSGSRASAAFEGATGGAGAGAGGVGAAGAEAAGGFFARLIASIASVLERFGLSFLAQILTRIAATAVGQMALAALAVMAAGAVAIAAVALMKGGAGGSQAAGAGAGDLGSIASSIKIHSPGDQGLDFASHANHGDVTFKDPNKKAEAPKTEKPEDTAKSDAAEKGKPVESGPLDPTAQAASGDSPHMSGNHLSSELGGALTGSKSGMFQNNFSFGKGMQSKLGGGFAKGALGGGKGSLVKSGMRGSTRANLGRRGLVNSRALGQVRAMGPQNAALRSGGATATEANSSAATEQFEGSKPTGTAPADASGGSGSSPSSSGGSGTTGSTPQNLGHGYACDQNQMEQGGMDVNGKCVICPSGYTPDQSGQCQIINTGEAAPWKSMLDQAMQQINQAITMLIVASIIVVALIAIAIIWTDTICSSWVGAILWALALLIACMFAYMAYQAGSMVKNIAGSIGKLGGSATDYQDKLNNLGDDLQTGAYLAILGGIGGLWYAGKVSGEEDDLQNMINNQMAAPKPPSTVAPTSVTGPGDSNLGSNNLGTQ